jgi:hypothetical protein
VFWSDDSVILEIDQALARLFFDPVTEFFLRNEAFDARFSSIFQFILPIRSCMTLGWIPVNGPGNYSRFQN